MTGLLLAGLLAVGGLYVYSQGQRQHAAGENPRDAGTTAGAVTVNNQQDNRGVSVNQAVNLHVPAPPPAAPIAAPQHQTEQLESSIDTKRTSWGGVRDSNDDVDRKFVAREGWYIDKSGSAVSYPAKQGSEAEAHVGYGREVRAKDGRMLPTEVSLRAHARSEEGSNAREGRCHAVLTFTLRPMP